MILEWVFGALVTAFSTILLAVLPEAGALPGEGAVTGAVHLFGWLDSFLPVTETLQLMLLVVEVLGVLAAVWVFVWVMKRLPFNLGGN